MRIPKNTSHNFPSRLLRFRKLWCTFTRFNLLFWPFTWFRSIVVDPCLIHRHKSTQKLFWTAVKRGQISLWSSHTNAFLVNCERSRQHISCTEVSHAQMCNQNIDRTISWDGYDLTHFHFRIIQNNIMDFIDHFWCSDLIWMTWTWCDFCARTL